MSASDHRRGGRDAAPPVFCPTCALPLVFRQTVTQIKGAPTATVEHRMLYECATCGPYELRVASPEDPPPLD